MLRGSESSRSSALTPRARRGATRAMAMALLAVVALAGMGVGFAADRLASHNEHNVVRRGPLPPPNAGPFRGPGGRDARRDMREKLAHDLGLTAEQQVRVDSIMARQMADFRRLREAMQPRFDSLLVQAQARLDSVLTPAQREKLKALRAREVFGPRDFGARDRRPPLP